MSISIATAQDIPELISLVNSAYRGKASKKGWTTEADLLLGDKRTDAASLEKIFNDKSSCILKYTLDKGSIAGCVYLQQQGNKLYLGMLSVNPILQSGGIGKALLKAAENHARQLQFNCITMTVINVRYELMDWYNRHGYTKTGNILPFPVDEKFGVPTQVLFFEVLEKRLA